MEEIINLPVTRGSNYERVHKFYEKLRKNFDVLQTLGEGEMLKSFVLSTLNKLPQVKPDLVRIDKGWEDWNMEKLIDSTQKWLERNKAEDQTETKRKECHYFSQKDPHCLLCNQNHWGDLCPTEDTTTKQREFFTAKRLCYNCARSGHTGKECCSRGCHKCKSKHHTSLCDKSKGSEIPMPL